MRVLDIYEKQHSSKTEQIDSPHKTEKPYSSETKDQSNKAENNKEEIRNFCKLQEKITQMKNRINFVESSKIQKNGKLETTVRKTACYINVRNLAISPNSFEHASFVNIEFLTMPNLFKFGIALRSSKQLKEIQRKIKLNLNDLSLNETLIDGNRQI